MNNLKTVVQGAAMLVVVAVIMGVFFWWLSDQNGSLANGDAEPTVAATTQPTVAESPPETAAPDRPSPPTSCGAVDGACIKVSFSGNACIYDGPANMAPGMTTLIVDNASDKQAWFGLFQLKPDKTAQDVSDLIEGGGVVPESWTTNSNNYRLSAGNHSAIEKLLLNGQEYTLVCYRDEPYLMVWYGGSFMVDD